MYIVTVLIIQNSESSDNIYLLCVNLVRGEVARVSIEFNTLHLTLLQKLTHTVQH